ncbi:MAG: sigma-70 family RNA polymerase sigma factor [Clostridiales bacterium]|nr:sigma-70 family RNA polymerase sigma factor [Clostridiales bacterium]
MPDFDELYAEHKPAVYKTCLAQFNDAGFAEEITQEAFAKAFAHRENLRDVSSFPSWVTTIAKRIGYNRRRLDQYRYNKLPPEDLLEQHWNPLVPDDVQVEDINFIRQWILGLKDDDQQIILLKYYHGLNDAEIGMETGKQAGTVKRRHALLRRKLREAAAEHIRTLNFPQ